MSCPVCYGMIEHQALRPYKCAHAICSVCFHKCLEFQLRSCPLCRSTLSHRVEHFEFLMEGLLRMISFSTFCITFILMWCFMFLFIHSIVRLLPYLLNYYSFDDESMFVIVACVVAAIGFFSLMIFEIKSIRTFATGSIW